MSLSTLSSEQQRIINLLYNEWQARPDGIGLHETALASQSGVSSIDLVREIQRLKAKGLVDHGYGSDDDRLGRIWLTDLGRALREE